MLLRRQGATVRQRRAAPTPPHPRRRRPAPRAGTRRVARPDVVGQPAARDIQRDGHAASRTTAAARWSPPMVEHANHAGTTSVATLTGPAGRPDERVHAHGPQSGECGSPSGRTVDALTFDGTRPGPGAARPRGRPRRGHAREPRRRRRRLDPLARSRRAERRGRRRGRHAGRGAARRAPRLPLPGRPAPGRSGTTRTRSSSQEVRRRPLRRLRRRAAAARARGEPRSHARLATTSPGRRRSTAATASEQRRVAAARRCACASINTDNTPRRYTIDGTPFRVLAIDGTDLHEPTAARRTRTLEVAAGGRYDVGFTMPRRLASRLAVADTRAALLLGPDGAGDIAPAPTGADVRPDRLRHACAARRSAPEPLRPRPSASSIGRKPGFFDGRPGHAVDDQRRHLPRRPDVRRRAAATWSRSRSRTHGGRPSDAPARAPHARPQPRRRGRSPAARGGPTRSTSIADERYDVAFRADNPGIWMDHCHNLDHAAAG